MKQALHSLFRHRWIRLSHETSEVWEEFQKIYLAMDSSINFPKFILQTVLKTDLELEHWMKPKKIGNTWSCRIIFLIYAVLLTVSHCEEVSKRFLTEELLMNSLKFIKQVILNCSRNKTLNEVKNSWKYVKTRNISSFGIILLVYSVSNIVMFTKYKHKIHLVACLKIPVIFFFFFFFFFSP